MTLRSEAEGWLRTKGTDQWSDPETGERAITKWHANIDEGRAWVVVGEHDKVLATVSRGAVDRDFWTNADRPESALYLYKLIVAREAAGRHLGTRIIDWMSRLAALEGRTWVRIDTWRTNTGLHSYYERLGFEHVRTEAPPHRRSGWLAQRPAGDIALPHDLLSVTPDTGERRNATGIPKGHTGAEMPGQREAAPSQFPSHSPSSADVHGGARTGQEYRNERG
ncbi:GNAT family N-acetyltransferase [Streptomyces sp. RPA4-2]|uniref:GNAT family N-acetyltransferase n=1 Tax=Streptomyces sp. RPA4-2 TaxID=2721244 RepID=UPI002001DF58|nr:GNAT family N-acetyltransferase [Streptomyces sp. RPA4-2]